MLVELPRKQYIWQSGKGTAEYKNGLLLYWQENLHEDISVSALSPRKSILQPGQALQEKWFKSASPWQQETTAKQCIVHRNS